MSTFYTQTIIYEAYHTDGGGQGYHTGTIGFFTKQSVAEAAREADKNPYTGLRERNAINIGEALGLRPNDAISSGLSAEERDASIQAAREEAAKAADDQPALTIDPTLRFR